VREEALMGYNLVTGAPSLTGYAPPKKTLSVSESAEGQERPERPEMPEPTERPNINQVLGGAAGANPTAGYRRFEQDGGEGSMGHHWEHLGEGKE
jgi:hypothetical protein